MKSNIKNSQPDGQDAQHAVIAKYFDQVEKAFVKQFSSRPKRETHEAMVEVYALCWDLATEMSKELHGLAGDTSPVDADEVVRRYQAMSEHAVTFLRKLAVMSSPTSALVALLSELTEEDEK